MDPSQTTAGNGGGPSGEAMATAPVPGVAPPAPGGAAGAEAVDTSLPPGRWTPTTLRNFAIAMLVLVCLAWALIAIPRAQEFAGVSEQSGGGAETRSAGDTATADVGGGNGEMVVVLAAISIAVVLVAAGVRAFVYSLVQEAIDEENEDTERYADDADAAEGAANAARYEANRLTAKIDATPARVETELAIQETMFWEAHHLRAQQRPDLYGGWEAQQDRETAAKRTAAKLWGPASVPTKEEIETLIEKMRTKADEEIAPTAAGSEQQS